MNGNKYGATVHPVFPGIHLVYLEAHTQHVSFGPYHIPVEFFLEITHCAEGRLECELDDGFCYLEPGDMLIAHSNKIHGSAYFPLMHYHGISNADVHRTSACRRMDGVNTIHFPSREKEDSPTGASIRLGNHC